MIEHRLIERMIALFAGEQRRISEAGAVDYGFFDIGLDFFKTYVDRFHHGKEEDILFRDLAEKPLSPEYRKMLNELIEEHGRMRAAVERLVDIQKRRGDEKVSLTEIVKHSETLINLYPVHIEKEDRHFFISAMSYLSAEEQAAMLEKSREFDRNFTQHRFTGIIKELEAAKK
jgi:hemerythrin-like domain-containing protein